MINSSLIILSTLILAIFIALIYFIVNNIKLAKAGAVDKNVIDTLQRGYEQKDEQINQLKIKLDESLLNANMLKEQNISLTSSEKFKDDKILELTDSNIELNDTVNNLNFKLTQISNENTKLQEQLISQEQLEAKQKEQYLILLKEFEQRITNTTSQMLEKRSEQFDQSSFKNFDNILKPLKEELGIFRELVNKSQKINIEQSTAVKEELLRLQQAQMSLCEQATGLTLALKGEAKTQGVWGEHQLELVLENSGLKQNLDYFREYSYKDDEGNKKRPDVIINLPEKNCLIIDAKCSLTAYSNYINCQDEQDKYKFLQEHIKSIYNHIKELSYKEYHNIADLKSPSFVFMFVPIDAALICALQENPGLYNQASANNIYLVGPSTLMPALKVVANLWIMAKGQDRIKDIVKNADNIYKKTLTLCNNFQDLQNKIAAVNASSQKVSTTLFEGKGNLAGMLEKFSACYQSNELGEDNNEHLYSPNAQEQQLYENINN